MLPSAIVRPRDCDAAFGSPEAGVRYAQLEPGILTVARRVLSSAPLTIVETHFNLAVRAEADIADGNTVVTLAGDERTRGQWLGCAFDYGDVAVARTCFDLATRGPATVYALSISRELGSGDGLLTRDPRRAAILRRHVRDITRYRSGGRHLLDFLATAVAHQPRRDTPLSRRVVAVRRCEEYVLEHVDANPTLLELSAVSGLGLRSLINAFRAVTGFSPMQYLKTQRLNAVRRVLASANNAQTRVIDVAAEWGFWHMGHFASDYRVLFGETPSQTLDRARRGRSVATPASRRRLARSPSP